MPSNKYIPIRINKRVWKTIRTPRTIYIAVGVFVGFFVLILLLLTCEPRGFQQPRAIPGNEVSPYLTHYLAPNFYNNIQLDRPFEVIIDQQGVNDILARYEWPVYTNYVVVHQPYTNFTAEEVVIMGKIKYGILPVVATMKARPVLDEKTGQLLLNLDAVKAGQVDMTLVARTIVSKLLTDEMEALAASTKRSEEYKKRMMEVWEKCTASLVRNEPIDPVFPAGKKYRIRLTGLRREEGRLVLQFQPE